MGVIPEAIVNLKEMQLLNFYNIRLDGTITPNVGNLTKLIELVLDRNRFSGAVPSRLGQLTELEFLSFCKSDDIVIVYC